MNCFVKLEDTILYMIPLVEFKITLFLMFLFSFLSSSSCLCSSSRIWHSSAFSNIFSFLFANSICLLLLFISQRTSTIACKTSCPCLLLVLLLDVLLILSICSESTKAPSGMSASTVFGRSGCTSRCFPK